MGQYLRKEIAEGVEGVDYIGVVVDAASVLKDPSSISKLFCNLKNIQSIKGLTEEKTPDAIILNKIDKIEKVKILSLIKLLSEHVNSLYASDSIEYIPISAKQGDGLELLLKNIKSKCSEGHLMFPADTITLQSDEQFASEIVREKAFIYLKEELPYGMAVQCRSWESTDKYETIFADIIVEKDSHKGIVVGKSGQMLQEIGTAARKELERIYGNKFVLKLFVRVEGRLDSFDWRLKKNRL